MIYQPSKAGPRRSGEWLGKAIQQRRGIIRISGLNGVAREGLTKKLKRYGTLHRFTCSDRC